MEPPAPFTKLTKAKRSIKFNYKPRLNTVKEMLVVAPLTGLVL